MYKKETIVKVVKNLREGGSRNEDPNHEIQQDQNQSKHENQSTDGLLWEGGSMMDYRTIIKSLSSGRYEILITGKLNVGDILKWGHDPKEEDGLERWQVISSERR